GIEQLLKTGEIDAILLASGGTPPTETTKKLFDDPYREIQAYYQATGVFPINTVMTIKEEVVRAHPELPGALMRAFTEARGRYQDEVRAGSELDHMGMETGKLRQMGLFPDQYGLGPNRLAIRMMVQYCYEQGLIRTLYEPEDLFVS
ncbi:MAG TPA: hypothetical protein VK457_01425, partial [Chloroflexota bacterium]|nr:hypothetical protein [Chloroflexota bacterium]